MGLRSSNKVEVNRYEMEVEVSAEDFSREVEKVYNKQKGKITVPGFRKGKAPKKFIEKYYGEQVFYEDAINSLYPKAVENAAKEAGLELVDDHIDFEIVTLSKEEGLVFKVKVTVMPEVKVENYKGIEVEKKSNPKVTAKDLEEKIKAVQEQNARLVSCEDGVVEDGNVVNIDFKGSIDSVPFEGGSAEDIELEIGKKQFIEGFESQIIGHKVGEKFDINVTFPENYHVTSLAGKEAIFNIVLNGIQKKELPVVDDEFVKDVSEFETLEEYKKDLKDKLLKEKKNRIENETDEEIKNKFLSLIDVEIPEALVKNKSKELIRDFEYRLKAQGLNLKEYLKYTGTKVEALFENFKPQALESVKMALGLKKVCELEKIEASAEEIEKEYELIAKSCSSKVEDVKKFVLHKDVEHEIVSKKAWELIKNSVVSK